MAITRMDHVSIVVGDLEAATAYFVELGMEVEGSMPIDADWAGRVVGIEGMRSEITMLRTPDGGGKIELARYRRPEAVVPDPGPAQPNAMGIRTVMFAVDDIEDTVERLRRHGGELVGEIADFEDAYRLCYMTGPEGVIVALAQPLG